MAVVAWVQNPRLVQRVWEYTPNELRVRSVLTILKETETKAQEDTDVLEKNIRALMDSVITVDLFSSPLMGRLMDDTEDSVTLDKHKEDVVRQYIETIKIIKQHRDESIVTREQKHCKTVSR